MTTPNHPVPPNWRLPAHLSPTAHCRTCASGYYPDPERAAQSRGFCSDTCAEGGPDAAALPEARDCNREAVAHRLATRRHAR